MFFITQCTNLVSSTFQSLLVVAGCFLLHPPEEAEDVAEVSTGYLIERDLHRFGRLARSCLSGKGIRVVFEEDREMW